MLGEPGDAIFQVLVFVAPGLGGYVFARRACRLEDGRAPWRAWLAGTALSVGLWAGWWLVAERTKGWTERGPEAATAALVALAACLGANAAAALLLAAWRRRTAHLRRGPGWARGRARSPTG